jgi:hypothetical protein
LIAFSGLSIENFENGSIIVTFSAKDTLAWEKLKQYCQRGSIDRLVKDIFNHEGLPEELKNGKFKMKLSIYESKESTSGTLKNCFYGDCYICIYKCKSLVEFV